MLKYLIKSTNEIRVETKDEAEALHQQVNEKAVDNNWTLSSWSETKKEKKSGGEVVEEWYIVKYTLTFNDAKDPEWPMRSIEYNITDSFAMNEEE